MSLDTIKQFLSYDPLTGTFEWVRNPNEIGGGGPKVGDVAGSRDRGGYLTIRFRRRLYYAHRLAWWWVYGEMPTILDHRNHNRADNRIENLRPATAQQNSANAAGKSDSLSGRKGVYAHQNGRYYAYVVVNRKKINLGGFGDLNVAARAYDAAAQKHFGDFAYLNFPSQEA